MSSSSSSSAAAPDLVWLEGVVRVGEAGRGRLVVARLQSRPRTFAGMAPGHRQHTCFRMTEDAWVLADVTPAEALSLDGTHAIVPRALLSRRGHQLRREELVPLPPSCARGGPR